MRDESNLTSIFGQLTLTLLASLLIWAGATSYAQTPDPELELKRLNFTEQTDIKIRCQTITNSVGDYRSCVWAELTKIKKGLADPEPELKRLNFTEQTDIKIRCQTRTSSVADYRSCVWAELTQAKKGLWTLSLNLSA